MAWQEVEGTKPPLAYNEEENKDVPKEVIKTELEQFTQEIVGGALPREKGEQLGSKLDSKNEVIFDSTKGYKK